MIVQAWIVGKRITPREQNWAPSGTHFHQFVVPPILSFRRDCTYGDLAAMRLPDDVQGLSCCEVKCIHLPLLPLPPPPPLLSLAHKLDSQVNFLFLLRSCNSVRYSTSNTGISCRARNYLIGGNGFL